jgi:hypothetical protein
MPPEAPQVNVTESIAQSVAEINHYRQMCGLSTLSVDTRLALAATHHAAFLARGPLSEEVSHTETPGAYGYTGRDAAERARATGYRSSAVWEDISVGAGTDSVDRLFNAPYHRVPFLRPDIATVGVGVASREDVWIRYIRAGSGEPVPAGANVPTHRVGTLVERSRRPTTVVEFGMSGASAPSDPFVYPLDGETGIPLSWSATETPDPLRMHAAEMPVTSPGIDPNITVGYVISYIAPEGQVNILSARLWSGDGADVPCYVNTPDNDEHIHGALLIPKKPLLPGTTYHVDVEAASRGGDDLSRRWSFTTAVAPGSPPAPAVPAAR